MDYNATIETLYADDNAGIYSYKVSELGEEYTLIIDIVENKFMVDNIVLTGEQYNQLAEEQVIQLEVQKKTRAATPAKSLLLLSEKYKNQKDSEIQSIYDSKHLLYIEESLTHEDNHVIGNPLLRCSFCSLNTISIPTTNYQSTWYYLGIFTQEMVIALTVGVITTVATYATCGATKVAEALIAGALAFLGGVASTKASVSYEKYIAYHKICPRANAEKRISYIQVQGNKTAKQTTIRYFYAAKPY